MGDSSASTAPLSHFLWTLSFSLSLVLVSAFLLSFLFFKATFISVYQCLPSPTPTHPLSQLPHSLPTTLGSPVAWPAWASVPDWGPSWGWGWGQGREGAGALPLPHSGKAKVAHR